eukprot:scaffold310_cov168-Amphora_coffeaeformis.AAC.4
MINENAQRESCQGAPVLVSDRGSSFPAPRFTLQKRKVLSDEPAPLTSVNSAFLCGLFADVAEAQSTDTVICDEKGSLNGCSRPIKRSRVSFSRSMVRTSTTLDLADQLSSSDTPSEMSILDLIDHALSPTSTTEIIKVQGGCVPFPQEFPKSSSPGTASPPTLKVRDNTSSQSREESVPPVFPHLPATISATSCNTLTRNLSDLQSSLAENSEKESYGWFVEMDDEYAHEAAPAYEPAQTNDLAFKAPTAPKAENHDAELEWAKAADTVDDVLGDFF